METNQETYKNMQGFKSSEYYKLYPGTVKKGLK